MNRLPLRLCLAALAAALAASCAERADAPLSPTFGLAAASLKSQIIPAPPPSDEPPLSSGQRAVISVGRYERDRPIPPQTAGTSAVANTNISITASPPAGDAP